MGILLDIANRTTTLTYIIQNRLERDGIGILDILEEELKKERESLKNILSDDEDIDNGQIFSKETGETLRDL